MVGLEKERPEVQEKCTLEGGEVESKGSRAEE